MATKARIQSRLKRSKRYVFTRDDFKDLAGYDQVGSALRELVKEGLLLKVGYGVYTKARQNAITGKLMPAAPGGSAAVILAHNHPSGTIEISQQDKHITQRIVKALALV